MIALLYLIFVGNVIFGDCDTIEGYYWRDYAGDIPTDALQGGSDYNGNPIFIAQALHEGNVMTARISDHDSVAYTGHFDKEIECKNNIKILCTQHPEHFKWIKTNVNEMNNLNTKTLVIGGYEPGFTVYVGRTFFKGHTLVGKASKKAEENLGLYFAYDKVEYRHKSFEILSYSENYKNTDIRLCQKKMYLIRG